MRILLSSVSVGMTLIAPCAAAQSSAKIPPARNGVSDFVTEAARRFAIPERWIYAVMRVESAGDPRAVSPKGATGLMQIMPATWRQLRARYALGNDIFDPHDNLIAGAGYLRELYDRYGSPGLFAAYNAGPARYEDYLARGVVLPGETISYVRRLAPVATQQADPVSPSPPIDPMAWTRSALFAGATRGAVAPGQAGSSSPDNTVDTGASPQPAAPPPARVPGLFIPLSGQSRR